MANVFESAFEQMVEREFAVALQNGATKLPFIDGTFDPLAPPEVHAEQKQKVLRALLARKWFEDEAPKFCQPLPLNEDERAQLYSSSDCRLGVVANYGGMLWGMDWDYQRAPSFFDYVQQSG